MTRLFFSYSHRDEDLRDELEIHLASLKRQGVLDTWHDRRIEAGQEVDDSISAELEKADVILLLVSPYFIASNYCYLNEMKKAMERHEDGDARVIPVILHPCDWHGLPFGKLMGVPRDGKAISKYPNLHDAFLDVTLSIKEVTKSISAANSVRSGSQPFANTEGHLVHSQTLDTSIRSANLGIKKIFTDRDIDAHIEDTFNYIADYIEGSLEELEKRNDDIQCEFRRIDTDHFTAKIYRNGERISQCKIWKSGMGDRFPGNILFSFDASGGDNGWNEQLSVESNDRTLSMKPMGMTSMFHAGKKPTNLTQEGAAEYYWSMLLRNLQ